MQDRNKLRLKRKKRIRVCGTAKIPRLNVFRSNKNLFLQAIDDSQGITLVATSTLKNSEEELAEILVQQLRDKKIKKIVFDRAGYQYHGKIKKVADALRKAGLEF